MKEGLQNSSMNSYETVSELRRKAQLKTEETIADLKILNGFNINDDESILPTELQLKIETIQKKSEELIEKTESYEKNLILESESSTIRTKVDEILAELEEKNKVADNWTKVLNSGKLKAKKTLEKAKLELNIKLNLKEINEKISLLPFNAKKMDFIENKQEVGSQNANKIGEMELKETILFENLNIFQFKEVESNDQKFTLPSRLFEILDNGSYVVGGYVSKTKNFHLFIYDPIKKLKKNEIILNNKRIDKIFHFKNKIALTQRKAEENSTDRIIKIMDENLNVIKETTIHNTTLKSVDESHLYCLQFNGKPKEILILFDWDLNEKKTNVEFQISEPDQIFYLKPSKNYHGIINYSRSEISQLFKRENNYILRFNQGYNDNLMVFSELGVLLKKVRINDAFVIDSKNNIITNNSRTDSFIYYDLNGELLKSVTFKYSKNDNKLSKKIRIDSADHVHFFQ